MKHNARTLLLGVLKEPERMSGLSAAEWDMLLRLARRANVLSQLAVRASHLPGNELFPAAVQRQFAGALAQVAEIQRAGRWEVGRIVRALGGSVEPVLLKGMAYFAAGLPIAEGRAFTDVDLLVPRPVLADTEARLLSAGWITLNDDAYDQHYYREWMHELPPMRHRDRAMPLDLHHAILPLTARLKPSSARIVADSQSLPGWTGVRVPAPVDLVLHACVHLCYDSDFALRLRDLLDVDGLLRHYDSPSFREEIIKRAREQQLVRPLWYALDCCDRLLGNPSAVELLRTLRPQAPAWVLRVLMRRLIPRAMLPELPWRHGFDVRLARLALFIRSHWLRMPPRLLVVHLVRKWRRRFA